MTRSKLCILLAALLIRSAPDASAAEPRFRPEQFCAGRTRSSGVFVNTFGKPHQRFTTECREGGVATRSGFDQTFRYDDGRTQKRRWQIRRVDAVHYVGRANDVVGQACGKVDGAMFQFAYTVALKPGNPLFHVRLDQTMTLQRDGTVENRATIVQVGSALSYRSIPLQAAC